MKKALPVYAIALAQACLAQSSPQIIGAGYAFPGQKVAPGQIITFSIAGARTVLPAAQSLIRADTVPLPTSLAGFSVSFSQGPDTPFQVLLPIFSVQQVNTCSDEGARPSCIITEITVQIPAQFSLNLTRHAVGKVGQWISVIENGTTTDSFRLLGSLDSIHILTGCDSIFLNPSASCTPKITHADGRSVSASDPAGIGESLIMYAVGLGGTTPSIPAGTLTPASAPGTEAHFGIEYSYLIDPGVSTSLAVNPVAAAPVTFSGLAPGQIGVYQVNFTVPSAPANTPSCPENPSTNLALTLAGSASRDSARICVKLPGRAARGGAAGGASPNSAPAPRNRLPRDARGPAGELEPTS